MVGHAAVFREDLGVTGVTDAALVEGLLVQGQRGDCVYAACDRQTGGGREKLVGGTAGSRIDDPWRDFGKIDTFNGDREARNDFRTGLGLLGRGHDVDASFVLCADQP